MLVAFEDGALLAPRRWPPRPSWRPGGGGGSTCWSRSPCRPTRRSTRAMPEQEARAAAAIDSARVRGGRRVTGPLGEGARRRGRPADRRARRARSRRAAIVMALPPRRTGALAVRPDARDRAGRPPLPGDHRLRAARGGAPATRRPPRASRPKIVGVQRAYVASSRRAERAAAPGRRGDGGQPRSPAAAGRWRWACPGRGASSLIGAGAAVRSRAPRARGAMTAGDGAGARQRAHGRGRAPRLGAPRHRIARGLGAPALFAIVARARSGRRSTSRSAWWPAMRWASRRSCSWLAALFFVLTMITYVEGSSLHPERGGALDVRALRVQRAVELRRRLGDPARLPDRDGASPRWRGRLPGRVLGRARTTAWPSSRSWRRR